MKINVTEEFEVMLKGYGDEEDSMHGRFHMLKSLKDIQDTTETSLRKKKIDSLANELYQFNKIDDKSKIENMVVQEEYDEIESIINSGDKHIDQAKGILLSIDETYNDYLKSEDYIGRLVEWFKDDDLRDARYEGESVRLTIVRQFVKNGITYKKNNKIDYDSLSEDIFDRLKVTDEEKKTCLKNAIKDCKGLYQEWINATEDLLEYDRKKRKEGSGNEKKGGTSKGIRNIMEQGIEKFEMQLSQEYKEKKEKESKLAFIDLLRKHQIKEWGKSIDYYNQRNGQEEEIFERVRIKKNENDILEEVVLYKLCMEHKNKEINFEKFMEVYNARKKEVCDSVLLESLSAEAPDALYERLIVNGNCISSFEKNLVENWEKEKSHTAKAKTIQLGVEDRREILAIMREKLSADLGILEKDPDVIYKELTVQDEVSGNFTYKKKSDLDSFVIKILHDIWQNDKIKEKAKSKRRQNYILVLANDLTKGIIKHDDKTRFQLLDFAVAFNMTCITSDENEVLEYRQDMDEEEYERIHKEKHRNINNSLFGDYFSNGFIRAFYVESIKASPQLGEDDKEEIQTMKQMIYNSIAAGIDYKSPKELVYIYYLNMDLTPKEKWENIQMKINRLLDRKSNDDKSSEQSKNNMAAGDKSSDQINNFMTAKIKQEFLDLDNEAEFRSLLVKYKQNKRNTIIKGREVYEKKYQSFLKAESAYDSPDRLRRIKEKKHISDDRGISAKKDLFSRPLGMSQEDLLRLFENQSSFYGNAQDGRQFFLDMFSEHMLRIPLPLDKIPEDQIEKNEVNRYNMLNVLYYTYLFGGEAIGKGLYEIFEDFYSYTKESLESARFQPLNAKNILDVLLVAMIYVNSYNLWEKK